MKIGLLRRVLGLAQDGLYNYSSSSWVQIYSIQV